MGWDGVKRGSGDALPILKIESGKTYRIRLIAGPGKLAEPEQRWQHWAEGEAKQIIKKPIACAGARTGCIFHQEPLKWRLSKQNLMNAVHYELENGKVTGKRIVVFGANQLYETIANQCGLAGIADPTTMDLIVSATGTGKQTQYACAMVPPIEPTVNLAEFPDQNPEFAADASPKLVDYDKFDGFKKRTPQEQMAWYEEQMAAGAGDPPADAAAATTTTTQAPPPPGPQTAQPPAAAPAAATPPKITMPRTAPPPPAPAAAAPPPPPVPAGPSAEDIAAAKAQIEAWNAGSSANKEHLQYVVDTDGFTQEQKDAATLLLSLENGGAAAPSTAATAGDLDAKRERVKDAIKNNPLFKQFANTRKFLGLTGKTAVTALDENDLDLLLGHIDKGTIAQAIGVAAA